VNCWPNQAKPAKHGPAGTHQLPAIAKFHGVGLGPGAGKPLVGMHNHRTVLSTKFAASYSAGRASKEIQPVRRRLNTSFAQAAVGGLIDGSTAGAGKVALASKRASRAAEI